MEQNIPAAANINGLAAPQTQPAANTAGLATPLTQPAAMQQQQEPALQNPTQTQAFSRRLKEMTEKAVTEATGSMRSRLIELENQSQDNELMANEDIKDLYQSIRTDVLKYATENKTDVKTAYKEVLATSMPTIIKNLKERINEEAEKRIKENFGASPGRLGGNTSQTPTDYSKSTPQEMDEFIKQALRGELRKS